jgi:hypothetical protein
MSIPDSDETNHGSIKKSALKIFGRKPKKPQKLLKLPDTAVAAKTLEGSRHIAISIPLEYDHLSNSQPSQRSGHSPNSSQAKVIPPPVHVTVLKPVVEGRESTSSHRNTPPRNRDGRRESSRSRPPSVATPPAELLGAETTQTLENYYTQLNRQQKLKEGTSGVKTTRSRRSSHGHVTVFPPDILRPDSQRTDSRHSAGTVYSSASTIAPHNRSRRVSSVSTAPSVAAASVKLDLPTRKSSISTIPKTVQTELAQNYATAANASREDAPTPSNLSEKAESLASETSTVVGTGETVQGYAAVSVTHLKGHTPKPLIPSPAPTRGLPDVPESPCIPDFLPSPSPPINRRSMMSGLIDHVYKTDSKPVEGSTDESNSATLQSRQERVKARKARDIAALREKSSREPLSDAGSTANRSRASSQTTTPNSPARLQKRRSMSLERSQRRSGNTLSPIMLVADLAPYTGTVYLSETPPSTRAARKRMSEASPNPHAAKGTYTPPRSFTSSCGSDSDSTPKMGKRNRSLARSPQPPSDRDLEARRRERRTKRNMSLRERGVEARLQRIERENAMLMSTLGGIANSFGELDRLLPKRRRRPDGLLGAPGMVAADGLVEDVVPVMRELQAGAAGVSEDGGVSSV